ncbi:MAG TPA: chloride channel protein [Acidobacteriota bacterium]|nr:chloride channel protein [Acidobacteriota bacterium]
MQKSTLASHELGYLRKWVPIAVLIGTVCGVGSLVFYQAINLTSMILLGQIAGYFPPSPSGEGGSAGLLSPYAYVIPVITTLGGLLSGIIVFGLAPEAEGHGTDAAIDAFHNKKGDIRSRIPPVKLLASTLTIGSGGSAGREGPTAQIGAGFGSFLGKALHLNLHDRRIAVAVGIGSGIGSIFKAPFGGALLSAEILYMGDFEVEALFPAFIASTIGYSIFASVTGWTPIFGYMTQRAFTDPFDLPFYAVLGAVCGLVGIVYVRGFYGIKGLFQRLNMPNFLKPAIGGLAVGVMGMFLPEILGMGYGWLQIAMNGNFTLLPLTLIPIIILAKIVATSLSIGSGGSGGVFAPALMIGGLVGTVIWAAFDGVLPSFQPSLAAFVIVGMMSFFGGVGKVPVAVILMVSEMTGGLTLLVPSMIATALAYIITGKTSIYKSQVQSRIESPAHRGEYSIPLLQKLLVKDAMTKKVITIRPGAPLSEIAELMTKNGIKGTPVVDSKGNLVGIVALTDILQINPEQRGKKTAEDVMTKELVTINPDENLYLAFDKMSNNQIGRLPVVDSTDSKKLIGIITREDIWRVYNVEIRSRLEETKLSGSVEDTSESRNQA